MLHMAMTDKQIIDQISQVLKKSRGKPATFIDLILCIHDLQRQGIPATCRKIIKKIWPTEWENARNKIDFEKNKWNLLCKRRRAINDRLFESTLCFKFFIDLTPNKAFVLIDNPEQIYKKRAAELQRNHAKANTQNIREKINATSICLEQKFKSINRSDPQRTAISPKYWIAAAVALLIVAALIFSINLTSKPKIDAHNIASFPPPASNPTGDISIAVLPFDNITNDPSVINFCEGITEDIIFALSNLPGIQVHTNNTAGSGSEQNENPLMDSQNFQQLGARYVLQGSIRKTGRHVRTTAQLSDVSLGHRLWAERWDRNFGNAFAVQDDVTMHIVTELVVNLKAGEHVRLFAQSTTNLKAFIKIIQAYHYFFENTLDDTLRARQLCQEAIVLDPNYVAAYALLADTYLKEVDNGRFKSPKQLIDTAYGIISQTLTVAPADALVHNVLSRVYTYQGRLDLALGEAEKAVGLYPRSVECINWQGLVLNRMGRHEEAITLFNRALSLNPKDPSLSFIFLGLAYSHIQRFEDAVVYLEKFMRLKPKATLESLHLAACYVEVGKADAARSIIAQVLRNDPALTVAKVRQRVQFAKTPSSQEHWLADRLSAAGMP